MAETEQETVRFVVRESGRGTFSLSIEPLGDGVDRMGRVSFNLADQTTFLEALHIANLMNTKIANLILTKRTAGAR